MDSGEKQTERRKEDKERKILEAVFAARVFLRFQLFLFWVFCLMFPGIPGEWRVLDLSGFERKGGAAGRRAGHNIWEKRCREKTELCELSEINKKEKKH